MISKKLAISGALALALLVAAAPAASAGEDESIDFNGGYVLFLDEGEMLYAADQVKDGYGVRAYLLQYGTSVVDAVGVGTRNHKNLSIPEGSEVWLKGCLTRKGHNVRCTQWQSATA
jgi:hypothetical protein